MGPRRLPCCCRTCVDPREARRPPPAARSQALSSSGVVRDRAADRGQRVLHARVGRQLLQPQRAAVRRKPRRRRRHLPGGLRRPAGRLLGRHDAAVRAGAAGCAHLLRLRLRPGWEAVRLHARVLLLRLAERQRAGRRAAIPAGGALAASRSLPAVRPAAALLRVRPGAGAVRAAGHRGAGLRALRHCRHHLRLLRHAHRQLRRISHLQLRLRRLSGRHPGPLRRPQLLPGARRQCGEP